jgi:hypothetical protein
MELYGMKLFALLGQSNMAGRGDMSKSALSPAAGIYKLDAALNWQPAQDPLHFDKPGLTGVGPGLQFAHVVAAQERETHSPVGLIPCAVGGTRIERWIKGGDLYEQALARIQFAMQHGELCGILWAQGESDSDEASCAEAYKERYHSLIRDLREDLGVGSIPFLASQLGTFLVEKDYPYTYLINEAVEQAGDSIDNYRWVRSEELEHKGDFLHYNADSARVLGERFAAAYLEMRQQ